MFGNQETTINNTVRAIEKIFVLDSCRVKHPCVGIEYLFCIEIRSISQTQRAKRVLQRSYVGD